MMFQLRHDFRTAPRTLYDGFETTVVPLHGAAPGLPDLRLDLTQPEASAWRHYYVDAELNALRRLLGWEMRFVLNREWAYHPEFGQRVNLVPLFHHGEEWTLSYASEERSPARYIFWLVAVLVRPQSRDEFLRRRAQIVRHWL